MRRTLEDLSHVVRPLPNGGTVLILDTGDLVDAETRAMLGARYSRSAKGAVRLIEEMFDRDKDRFMRENYQAGYGHKSIGELGDTSIFVDGVSMLCAKAIQDSPLYRGQESSTRYLDFSKQPFVDPISGNQDQRFVGVLEGWRTFYLEGLKEVIPYLIQRFPQQEVDDEDTYKKAIKARAFDIMRSFLPAGAMTNVAWMGDLRHVNDHLFTLRNHPLQEVRVVADVIEEALWEKHQNSFDPNKRYPESEAYVLRMGAEYGYFNPATFPDFRVAKDSLDYDLLTEYRSALCNRPPKTELPFAIRECGSIRFEFQLDFGSYRDLQRQRSLMTRMPLLTDRFGFEEWYFSEMPTDLHTRAVQFLGEQLQSIDELNVGSLEKQYCLPMGMRVPIRTIGDLHGHVYVVELRTTRFVHPTLCRRELQVADELRSRVGKFGLVLHLDDEPGRFDVRRGTHDIIERKK